MSICLFVIERVSLFSFIIWANEMTKFSDLFEVLIKLQDFVFCATIKFLYVEKNKDTW